MMEKGIYEFIWRYSRRQQIVITIITVASFPFLYAALELPKVIVNDAIDGKVFPQEILGYQLDQLEYLMTLCASLLALIIVNGAFLMAINIYKGISSERMLRRLRYQLFEHILRFPFGRFQKVSQGELASMITAEVEPIREFIADAYALPIFEGGTMLTILFFMFSQDSTLGAGAIALIPVQAWVIPKIQRKVNLLGKERVARARRLSGRISEAASGIRDIRTHNTAAFSLADFSAHLAGIFKVRYRWYNTKFVMKFINSFMIALTPLLFYSVGGYLIIQGEISVGSLVAVLGAYASLTNPWRELLRYYQRYGDAQIKYQQLVASFDHSDLISRDAVNVPDGEAEALSGNISFENVVAADADGVDQLDGVSFEIPAGGRCAIVAGASGRDTLANLLTRMGNPQGGQITIGGRPLSDVPTGTLGARVGYVGVDSYIFDGTIEYNSLFGLKHTPGPSGAVPLPPDAPTESHNPKESQIAGNSPHDPYADWTNYVAPGFENRQAVEDWWYKAIEAVELEDLLYKRGLSWSIDPSENPELSERLMQARERIMARLRSSEANRKLVHFFDEQTFNPNASVAANLVWGEPRTEEFAFARLGHNALVRSVLKDCGIDEKFQDVGLKMTEALIDMFGAQGDDHTMLDRFGFVDAETLEHLKVITSAASKEGRAALSENDQAELVSLTFQAILDRHRLGLVDKDLQAAIVKARPILRERMSDEQLASIATFDESKFNDRLSVRCNLLWGRRNLSEPNSDTAVDAIVRDVLVELDLMQEVVLTAMAVDVGIAGQRLPVTARQSLALARSLMKKPDILITNGALNGYDRDVRDRIRRKVADLLGDATLIWIDSEVPNAADFDEVLVLRQGRIEQRISEQAADTIVEVAEAPVKRDLPREVGAEAAALANVPLFEGISQASLKLLAFANQRVTFKSGEDLFVRGEDGDKAYLILSGEADILIDGEDGEKIAIAKRGRNELLGEIALLTTMPRTATVRAAEDVDALLIEKGVFLELIESDPRLSAAIARRMGERLAESTEKMMAAA